MDRNELEQLRDDITKILEEEAEKAMECTDGSSEAFLLGAAAGFYDAAVDIQNLIDERIAISDPAVPAEVEGDGRSTWWYVCGECHGAIDPKDKRCKSCGRRIGWE